MKKIAIVATGGTIAGSGKAGKATVYEAGTIRVEEVLATIPQISEIATIEMHDLVSVDSNEMNEEIWLKLLKEIDEIASRDDIDGIVVTHGTDTIEETAYFLNLTISTLKPVVLTGAMRPATATSADGPYNLFQAISLASHEEAIGRGVMCLFSSTIYSGRDIQKVNNYKIDAFDQKAFASLGYMKDDEVYFYSQPLKTHTKLSQFSQVAYAKLPRVGIAPFYAGASTDVLEALGKEHEGIVIVGTGSGNYSKKWQACIEKLTQQGIVFVRASRVINSIVFDDEVFDPQRCCIGANTLSPYKARVLLMLALTQTHQLDEIRKIFLKY